MQRDSILNTFIVAGGVCLVCSLLVSSAAVILKPRQDANVLLDRKMNILLATGDFKKEELNEAAINENFDKQIEDRIIDLATGEDVTDSEYDNAEEVNSYDQFKASKKKDCDDTFSTEIDRKLDVARVKRRENHSHVYIYQNKQGRKVYIFPIRGYGLWSTLKGFIALKDDFRTIAGLTYYEHKETPGLGGEVDNPKWKAQWQGKLLTDESGKIKISVVSAQSDPKYKVDSLSGATITSRGVENMIKYWMGEQGFGKYLERLRSENPPSQNQPSAAVDGGDE